MNSLKLKVGCSLILCIFSKLLLQNYLKYSNAYNEILLKNLFVMKLILQQQNHVNSESNFSAKDFQIQLITNFFIKIY